MPASPARIAAFEILLRVEQQQAFASELLHSSRYQELSAADHRLGTEIVMGVLRWRSALDEQIESRSSLPLAKLDPQVLTALRMAILQLMFLDRVPQRAAIYESVELVKRAQKRSAAPFVNAVLRKLASSKPHVHAISDLAHVGNVELARHTAHPEWLVARWVDQFGLDAARQICGYDQQIPETVLSVSGAAGAELEQQGVKLAPGRLVSSARRLLSGDLTHLPTSLQNQIRIQDEASQLAALLVGRGSKILDCCAAPGGKTRIIAEQNPSATVIAAELHPRRAHLMRKLVKSPNVRVIAADARALPLNAKFDRVLVDAPCSGTGTLARNPEIKWRLKLDDLRDLQSRQIDILRSAMAHLASGGMLVYATCSLEREENEEVIEATLAAQQSFRLLDCAEQLRQHQAQGELVGSDVESLTRGPFLRTIPGLQPCDGFFAAVVQKC